MEKRGLAGPIGEAVGVAPDLAALAIHAGIFVVVPAHGETAFFGRQPEIGKFCGWMRFVHRAFRQFAGFPATAGD